MKTHKIRSVQKDSIAEELEIENGDELLSINGQEVKDVFDYRYLCLEEELTVLIRKANGEEWELDIEKDEEEELGIEFENPMMDDYRSCSNNCIFCFIDQMPPGMRDTLYFKDDDSRLSFLQGNYVTLTNMKDEDLERVITYHLAPINISVHTTNPELRNRMLHNRFAGEALKKIDRLYEAGIPMNGQIVLCKGINDGEELSRTIEDLSAYLPHMGSLSVVPVGLTRFREGLYPLEPFEKEDAIDVLERIHKAQEQCVLKWDNHFVHASDEWYLLAGEEIPEAENYDGYPQLANGVGMMRLLHDEFLEELEKAEEDLALHGEKTMCCGMLIAPLLKKLAAACMEKFPNLRLHVLPVRNDFFGERITVSGLLTGQDVIAQCKGKPLGTSLLITSNMLRFGENVLLDDVTVMDLEQELGVKVTVVGPAGRDLLEAMTAQP